MSVPRLWFQFEPKDAAAVSDLLRETAVKAGETPGASVLLFSQGDPDSEYSKIRVAIVPPGVRVLIVDEEGEGHAG